jgi:tRNA threonylcarbamoyladenosine biosynthesis protein TsaB
MSAMTQTVLLAIDTSTEYCSVALLRSAPADAAVPPRKPGSATS